MQNRIGEAQCYEVLWKHSWPCYYKWGLTTVYCVCCYRGPKTVAQWPAQRDEHLNDVTHTEHDHITRSLRDKLYTIQGSVYTCRLVTHYIIVRLLLFLMPLLAHVPCLRGCYSGIVLALWLVKGRTWFVPVTWWHTITKPCSSQTGLKQCDKQRLADWAVTSSLPARKLRANQAGSLRGRDRDCNTHLTPKQKTHQGHCEGSCWALFNSLT